MSKFYNRFEDSDEKAGRFFAEEQMYRQAEDFMFDLWKACDDLGCSQEILDEISDASTDCEALADESHGQYEGIIYDTE